MSNDKTQNIKNINNVFNHKTEQDLFSERALRSYRFKPNFSLTSNQQPFTLATLSELHKKS
jgi:hypothetical protein